MSNAVELTQTSDRIEAANAHVAICVDLRSGTQQVFATAGEAEDPILQAPFLLLQRKGGYGDVIPLAPARIRVVAHDPGIACFEVTGENDDYVYGVTYSLRAGDRHITGRVRFKPKVNQVGWFCYGLHADGENDHWCYPWVSGKQLRLPTVIGRSIGITRPNHIWTALAGIPAIQGRRGSLWYSLGFPVDFDYRDASLTFNDENAGPVRLALGIRRARGVHVEDSVEEYLASSDYAFPFQICIGKTGVASLAEAWIRANAFTFDTAMRHTPAELEAIFVSGRRHDQYRGARRYLSEDRAGLPAAGYIHGSDDTRIALLKQARNACIDWILYRKTGDNLWRDRASEQLEFLAASQTEIGAVRENWDFVTGRYYFQGIDEFGFHPDQQALACEYWYRVIALMREDGHPAPDAWREAAGRHLDWLLSLVKPDGSISQTVVSSGKREAAVTRRSAGNMAEESVFAATDRDPGEPAPLSRLLSAFVYLAEHTGRADVWEAMLKHEEWVIEKAFARQYWWGHWPDTNLTTTLYAGLKFIEYCVKRFESDGGSEHLDRASEIAYWCFFQTVPKQLEGNRQYTRGAVIEQDNYMQFNSAIADNLILSALRKLSRHMGNPFFHDLARQYYQTACHAVSDDPRHPWYGSANMYVADPLGLTVPFDTDPATGGATKYAGTIVNAFLEDIWESEKHGLFE